MEKRKYVIPKAVVKSMSAIDGILYISGPGGDPNDKATNADFDAKENNLGFSDDWFDYDSSSDL